MNVAGLIQKLLMSATVGSWPSNDVYLLTTCSIIAPTSQQQASSCSKVLSIIAGYGLLHHDAMFTKTIPYRSSMHVRLNYCSSLQMTVVMTLNFIPVYGTFSIINGKNTNFQPK